MCDHGPNLEVVKELAPPKVYSGIKTYAKAEALVLSLVESLSLSDIRTEIGALKFEIRREEDAAARLAKIAECFELLDGEVNAAKTEPFLVAELLLLRSKEVMRRDKPAAEADTRRAAKLRPDWGLAEIQLGSVLEARGKLQEAEEALRRSLNCMNVDEKAVRRQLARVVRKMESAQHKRWSTTQAVAVEAATLPKPHRTPDCQAATSTDPVLAQLVAARPPKGIAPVNWSVPGESPANAKPAAAKTNLVGGVDADLSCSAASTTDRGSRESTQSTQEGSFAVMLDEEDSELLDHMMQVMQTGKVSFTLCGKSQHCRVLSISAMGPILQKGSSSAVEATDTDAVRSHDGPFAALAPPTRGISFCQGPAIRCKLSTAGSAAEHEAAPMF
jgi:hypothetical protein